MQVNIVEACLLFIGAFMQFWGKFYILPPPTLFDFEWI